MVKIELDKRHSEMFPYAIKLAEELGAEKIYIEADVKGKIKHRPDILGIRGKEYLIIECETSHGNIFNKGGPVHKMSQDELLRKNASFHFILRGKAWYRRSVLKEYFGNDAKIYRFSDLKKKYGEIWPTTKQ